MFAHYLFDYYLKIMISYKLFQSAECIFTNEIAEKYVSHMEPRYGAFDGEFDKLSLGQENGFLWDEVKPEPSELQGDGLPKESASEVGISDAFGS